MSQSRWILALAVACAACGSKRPAPTSAAAPLPAELQRVAQAVVVPSPASSPAAVAAPETQVSESDGTLSAPGEFVSPVRSELVSRLPGRVARILADVGDRVHRGQPLLELEPQYLALDVDRAEAELRRAEAVEAEADRDFARKKDLIARESVAPALFDRTRAVWEQAQAATAAARAARDLARQRLEDAVLRSPIDGVVMERRTDVGERLGDNTVAFVLVQTAPLKLRFQLPERYLPAVSRGLVVRAQVDPFPGETFEGTLSAVVDAVDPGSRTFLVEAEFANRDGRLRPGLFARVELHLEPSQPIEG